MIPRSGKILIDCLNFKKESVSLKVIIYSFLNNHRLLLQIYLFTIYLIGSVYGWIRKLWQKLRCRQWSDCSVVSDFFVDVSTLHSSLIQLNLEVNYKILTGQR